MSIKNLQKRIKPRRERRQFKRGKSALNWKPHRAQKQILRASKKYRYLVLVCGRRFGKTELVLHKLLKDCWQNPGDYVYIAPTRTQAKRIAWRKLKRIFPDSLKDRYCWKNESELWVQNSRGGRIIILGADQPDTLRGEGWKGLVFDEYADIKPYAYAAIRPALSDYKGWIWFIGTPKGHDHFYEWFIKDKQYHDPTYKDINDKPVKISKSVKSFRFSTSDNPHIDPKEIDSARDDLSPEMFAQEYEASFENYTGLVYKEFMRDRNKIILKSILDKTGRPIGCINGDKTIMFKPYFHYYIGLDTGTYTGCVCKCIDDEGNEYIVGEVYNIGGIVKDISSEIKQLIYNRNVRGKVIDSASQVKKEYENNGLHFVNSKKDITLSIQIVRRKIKQKRWYILDNCTATIREMSSRRWPDKVKNGKHKKPVDENDHCINAEDYIQMTFLDTEHEKEKEYWKKKNENPVTKKLRKSSIKYKTEKHEKQTNLNDYG